MPETRREVMAMVERMMGNSRGRRRKYVFTAACTGVQQIGRTRGGQCCGGVVASRPHSIPNLNHIIIFGVEDDVGYD